MTTLRERVAGERRRLKSVREALTASVARKSGGDAAFVPFYIAAADYMETSMGRLHAQDVKMGNMIREKLGTLDANATQALKELDERLEGNQQLLHRFTATRDRLKTEGAKALDAFEDIAREYTQYIVTNMGHHGATTELAARLFSQEDWEYMAGVTPEETRLEQELYNKVFGALPPALQDLRPTA
jgi:hypothetical protein